METELSVALEVCEISAMQAKVSLSSFIDKNPWFGGKVYLLTYPEQRFSNKTLLEIRSIHDNVEELDVSQHMVITELMAKIKNTARDPSTLLIDSLKLGCLTLSGPVLYISNRSLFLSSVSAMTETDTCSVSTIMNSDASSIFYLSGKIDKDDLMLKVYTNILNDGAFPSKRKLDSHFSEELKKLSGIKIFQTGTVCSASSYLDKYFNKLKSSLNTVSCIHFEDKVMNNPLYTKINQIWLHKARSIRVQVSRPSSKYTLTKGPDLSFTLTEKKIESKEKELSVSVIIPAHKAANYIEECLDSIASQVTPASIEILLGVDNCSATLKKVSEIKNKYKSLRVFFSNKSLGAYVMRNSLVNLSNNQNLLFFDADDIMKPLMISSILKKYNMNRPIRFKYINFNHGENHLNKSLVHPKPSHGIFFIPRSVFDKVGGFRDWPCGADTEFMKRCSNNRIPDLLINLPLFYRRVHSSSLTQDPNTGYRSSIRARIATEIKNNKDWSIPIDKKTYELEEIK